MNNIRILYIEDDRAQRQALTKSLRSRGFTVRPATSGISGLSYFERQRFDVVLCDLNLPDLNGLDLLKRARKIRSDVPFIILTAHGTTPLAVRAIKAGAYHFILKPLDINDIEFTVYQAIETSRLQKKLQRSENDMRVLMENVPDIVYSLNDRGEFLSISPAIKPVLGYSVNEVIGRSLFDFVYEEDRGWLKEGFLASFESPHEAASEVEFRMVSKHGEVKFFEVNGRTITENGKRVRNDGVARDVTVRKQLEQRLTEYSEQLEAMVRERTDRLEFANRQLEALNEVSRRFAQILDPDELLEEAPRLLTRSLAFDRAALFLHQDDRLMLRSCRFEGDSPELKAEFERRVAVPIEKLPPQLWESFTSGRTIHIPDLETDPRWPSKRGQIIRGGSLFISPLKVKGKPAGLMVGNLDCRDREIDVQDIARFEAFVNMVGLALDNIQVYENLEQQVAERTRDLKQKARKLESSQLALSQANVGLLAVQEELEEKNAQMEKLLGELSKSKNELQAILDSSGSAMVMVNLDNRIIATNRVVRDLFGLADTDILHTDIMSFFAAIRGLFTDGGRFDQLLEQLCAAPDDSAIEPSQIRRRALDMVDTKQRTLAVFSLAVLDDADQELGRVWTFTDVTRMKKADEQIRALVDVSPIPSIISRVTDGTILYANDHLAAMVGLENRPAAGESAADFYYDPEDRKKLLELLKRDGVVRNFEVRLKRIDGTVIWTIFSLVLSELAGESVIVGGIYDISERKKAEEALRRERNFVSAVLDTAGALVVVLDADSNVVRFNRACEQVSGYTFNEVKEKSVDMFLCDDERDRIHDLIDDIKAGHYPVGGENYWLTKDGRYRLISWSNTALVDDNGAVEYIIACGIDITEAREAEEKLRLYRRIFDTSPDGITIFDADMNLVGRNPAHQANSGYDDKDVIGQPATRVLPPEAMKRVSAAMAEQGLFRGEVDIRRSDGSALPLDLSVMQIKDEAGKLLYTVGMGRDISLRREAELALKKAHDELEQRVEERTAELGESEAKNRALLNVIPDLMFRLDRDGTYLDYRAPKDSPLAMPPDEIVGGTINDTLSPELAARTHEAIRRTLDSGELQTLEYDMVHDGETHYFEARIVISGPDEVLAIVRDVTERNRAVEELKQAHGELESRVQQRTAQLARVNDTLRSEVRERRQAQEALSTRLRYEEAIAACSQALLIASESDDPLREVLHHLRQASGSSRVYLCENFNDPDHGLSTRMTYEVRASGLDPAGRLVDGLTFSYARGLQRWQDSMSRLEPVTDNVATMPAGERELFAPLGLKSMAAIPIAVDGGWFGFIGFDDELSEREWADEDTRSLRTAAEMIGVYLERRKAQAALRYSEERFRGLVENANDVIFSARPDGRLSYISPRFTELVGYPTEEFIDRPIFEMVQEDRIDDARRWFEAGMPDESGKTGFEHRIKNTDGQWRWFDTHASILRDETGRAMELVGVMHDMTDVKRVLDDLANTNRELRDTQSQLVQSEKMASLGSLVAGIAHEINTPIGAVASMHDTLVRAIDKLRRMLAEQAPPTESKQDDLGKVLKIIQDANDVIRNGTERVTTIVRRLRSFARLDEAELKTVNIHEGLEDTLMLIHHEIKGRIEVVREYGEIPAIACYPGRLNQVFLNLLNNARQAVGEQGTVTITTFEKDGYVNILFKDDGVGIPQDKLNRVFDPGFTTKGVGVGTGLGLSICYGIIQDHRGEISVASKVGEGTVFTIVLPTDLDRRLDRT